MNKYKHGEGSKLEIVTDKYIVPGIYSKEDSLLNAPAYLTGRKTENSPTV
jgi:hypothetical protein